MGILPVVTPLAEARQQRGKAAAKVGDMAGIGAMSARSGDPDRPAPGTLGGGSRRVRKV
ncbi:MAG: hypothetical protein J2P28_03675 [Actinobacteria bacterium]|nr:hypothetical protein [Actinomycetota bacterium]